MTVAKAGLLSAGFVAVFAAGVMTGPTILDNWSTNTAPDTTVAAPAAEPATPAPVKTARPASRARASSARVEERPAMRTGSNTVNSVPVALWEPRLRDRVKDVLNPGTRLEMAAEDFASAEEFVTVAHAARNTQVPFVVLKDRVLTQGRSLADAIHEFKPELDAKAEVTRARAEAMSDLESAN